MFYSETKRLRIRPLEETDAGFINRLYNSEGFLRFIGDRNIRSDQDARDFLVDGPIKMYQQAAVGLCMVELKDAHTPVGICGLVRRETLADIDIGYAFLPEFWQLGYAFEAALAVFEYARDVLRLRRLVAITQADNAGSIKVLEKLGLHLAGNLEAADGGPSLELYEIDFS